MSRPKKQSTPLPGILRQDTVKFFQDILQKNSVTSPILVDRDSFAKHGIAWGAQFPKPPRFVVLVDKNEKGTHSSQAFIHYANMCSVLQQMGVWAVPLICKTGDYIILELLDNEQDACMVSSSSSAPNVTSDPAPSPRYRTLAVIERKTRADLVQSLYTGHRADQRAEMAKTGAPVLVWMITEPIDGVMDPSSKRLHSVICHETFSLAGLEEGQKTAAIQLRSDADVPQTLFNAVRWLAEDVLSSERPLLAKMRQSSSHQFAKRMRHTDSDDAEQRYSGALCHLVDGLGEGHALAIQKTYPTLLHMSRDAIEAANVPAKRAAMRTKLANTRCDAVMITTDPSKSRCLGEKTADRVIDALVKPYENMNHGWVITMETKKRPAPVMEEDGEIVSDNDE